MSSEQGDSIDKTSSEYSTTEMSLVQWNSTSKISSEQGDSSIEAILKEGNITAKTSSEQGDSTIKTSSKQGDSTAETSSKQGDSTAETSSINAEHSKENSGDECNAFVLWKLFEKYGSSPKEAKEMFKLWQEHLRDIVDADTRYHTKEVQLYYFIAQICGQSCMSMEEKCEEDMYVKIRALFPNIQFANNNSVMFDGINKMRAVFGFFLLLANMEKFSREKYCEKDGHPVKELLHHILRLAFLFYDCCSDIRFKRKLEKFETLKRLVQEYQNSIGNNKMREFGKYVANYYITDLSKWLRQCGVIEHNEYLKDDYLWSLYKSTENFEPGLKLWREELNVAINGEMWRKRRKYEQVSHLVAQLCGQSYACKIFQDKQINCETKDSIIFDSISELEKALDFFCTLAFTENNQISLSTKRHPSINAVLHLLHYVSEVGYFLARYKLAADEDEREHARNSLQKFVLKCSSDKEIEQVQRLGMLVIRKLHCHFPEDAGLDFRGSFFTLLSLRKSNVLTSEALELVAMDLQRREREASAPSVVILILDQLLPIILGEKRLMHKMFATMYIQYPEEFTEGINNLIPDIFHYLLDEDIVVRFNIAACLLISVNLLPHVVGIPTEELRHRIFMMMETYGNPYKLEKLPELFETAIFKALINYRLENSYEYLMSGKHYMETFHCFFYKSKQDLGDENNFKMLLAHADCFVALVALCNSNASDKKDRTIKFVEENVSVVIKIMQKSDYPKKYRESVHKAMLYCLSAMLPSFELNNATILIFHGLLFEIFKKGNSTFEFSCAIVNLMSVIFQRITTNRHYVTIAIEIKSSWRAVIVETLEMILACFDGLGALFTSSDTIARGDGRRMALEKEFSVCWVKCAGLNLRSPQSDYLLSNFPINPAFKVLDYYWNAERVIPSSSWDFVKDVLHFLRFEIQLKMKMPDGVFITNGTSDAKELITYLVRNMMRNNKIPMQNNRKLCLLWYEYQSVVKMFHQMNADSSEFFLYVKNACIPPVDRFCIAQLRAALNVELTDEDLKYYVNFVSSALDLFMKKGVGTSTLDAVTHFAGTLTTLNPFYEERFHKIFRIWLLEMYEQGFSMEVVKSLITMPVRIGYEKKDLFSLVCVIKFWTCVIKISKFGANCDIVRAADRNLDQAKLRQTFVKRILLKILNHFTSEPSFSSYDHLLAFTCVAVYLDGFKELCKEMKCDWLEKFSEGYFPCGCEGELPLQELRIKPIYEKDAAILFQVLHLGVLRRKTVSEINKYLSDRDWKIQGTAGGINVE